MQARLDLTTGAVRTASGRHSGSVNEAVFTPEGRTLVTVGPEGDLILWDVRTAVAAETLSGHTRSAFSPQLADGGATLYTASVDGTVLEWDLAGHRRLGTPFPTGRSDDASVRYALSSDGRLLAHAQEDGTVSVVDMRSPTRPQHAIAVVHETGVAGPSGIDGMGFVPGTHLLVAGSEYGTVSLVDADHARVIRRLRAGPREYRLGGKRLSDPIWTPGFSADGRLLTLEREGPKPFTCVRIERLDRRSPCDRLEPAPPFLRSVEPQCDRLGADRDVDEACGDERIGQLVGVLERARLEADRDSELLPKVAVPVVSGVLAARPAAERDRASRTQHTTKFCEGALGIGEEEDGEGTGDAVELCVAEGVDPLLGVAVPHLRVREPARGDLGGDEVHHLAGEVDPDHPVAGAHALGGGEQHRPAAGRDVEDAVAAVDRCELDQSTAERAEDRCADAVVVTGPAPEDASAKALDLVDP